MREIPLITILMATYNGERYIEEQLNSLIGQTYSNWELLIRDDGSNDNTIEIIEKYKGRYDNIHYVVNRTKDKGACLNFATLFSMAVRNETVNYVMFCDQDDIWKPEKIEMSVKTMLEMECKYPGEPVLIYGDFEMMDTVNDLIPGSFNLLPKIELNNLISFNYVYGCTMIMDRELMNKIKDIPPAAINHDYWIALVASMYKSKYISEKYLRYRQHSDNVSGNVVNNNSIMARLNRNILKPDKENEKLRMRLDMLSLFYRRYGHELTTDKKDMLKDYLEAFDADRLKVCFVMLQNKIFRNGFFQTFVSFFQILLFFKKVRIKNLVRS